VEEASPEGLHFKPVIVGEHAPIYFDIAIPELKLIVEYHGRLHYQEVFKSAEVKQLKERDTYKAELCRANGFALVIIPYWWNQKWDSLAKEIAQTRPDILIDT